MLREQTRDYISKLSEEGLIEYVLEGIYEPEAVAFAKQEIERRHIDPQRFSQLHAVAAGRVEVHRAEAEATDSRPLGRIGKTFAFIGGFCGLIWPLFLAWMFLDNGSNTKKRKDIWTWAAAGFCTALFVVVLFGLFRRK